MRYIKQDKILYAICEEDIQNEAIDALGRKLTKEELEVAVDGLEWGIDAPLSIIYNTIFTEIIPKRANNNDN